jgi:hypothetical protein
MPNHRTADRVALLRKKLADRKAKGTPIVIHNALDANLAAELLREDGIIAKHVRISINTPFCCGVEEDTKCVKPCQKRTKLEFAHAFCSREHQVAFEQAASKFATRNFYEAVSVVNVRRPELAFKFYTEFLPLHFALCSTLVQKPLVWCVSEDVFENVKDIVNDLSGKRNKFLELIADDIVELTKAIYVTSLTESAIKNSASADEIPERPPVQIAVYTSPFDSPRSDTSNTNNDTSNTNNDTSDSDNEIP